MEAAALVFPQSESLMMNVCHSSWLANLTNKDQQFLGFFWVRDELSNSL